MLLLPQGVRVAVGVVVDETIGIAVVVEVGHFFARAVSDAWSYGVWKRGG